MATKRSHGVCHITRNRGPEKIGAPMADAGDEELHPDVERHGNDGPRCVGKNGGPVGPGSNDKISYTQRAVL